MASRLRAHLPRVAAFVLVGLTMTAALSYAAGRNISSTPPPRTTAAPTPPLVVPNVRNEAFVFAKGTLEDAGFAWRVLGSVHGYAPNTVVVQSPPAGTRVLQTGAPTITLTLKRNGTYPQTGAAEDVSPYAGSVIAPADLAAAVGPAHPAGVPTPQKPQTAPTTGSTATTPATAMSRSSTSAATRWPQNRPPAFMVPGAPKEPLDEMPLTNRATLLGAWLVAHPKRTNANVSHWLYQNEWIVTGAKLGWWHGADALATLIAVDRRAQKLWGIGSKSASVATHALTETRSRSK